MRHGLAEGVILSAYEHRQTGVVPMAILVFAALGLVLGAIIGGLGVAGWILAAVVIVLAISFTSLTVEIADGQLAWRFGPGLMRKRVPLTDVARASKTRTTWYEGWGIRRTRRGWLYNVAGFDFLKRD